MREAERAQEPIFIQSFTMTIFLSIIYSSLTLIVYSQYGSSIHWKDFKNEDTRSFWYQIVTTVFPTILLVVYFTHRFKYSPVQQTVFGLGVAILGAMFIFTHNKKKPNLGTYLRLPGITTLWIYCTGKSLVIC